MELAIPVAVKFLHQGNKELCRNICSYLSLAAIDNTNLLAQNVVPIIDSCITGVGTLPLNRTLFTGTKLCVELCWTLLTQKRAIKSGGW